MEIGRAKTVQMMTNYSKTKKCEFGRGENNLEAKICLKGETGGSGIERSKISPDRVFSPGLSAKGGGCVTKARGRRRCAMGCGQGKVLT